MHGLAFDYEEHTFELSERFRFPNKYFKMTSRKKDMTDRSGSVVLPITYKPDFVGKDHDWIIETKGFLPSHPRLPHEVEAFLRHLVGNQAKTIVFLAKNSSQVDQAIQEILQSIKDGDIETQLVLPTTLAIGFTRSLTICTSPCTRRKVSPSRVLMRWRRRWRA